MGATTVNNQYPSYQIQNQWGLNVGTLGGVKCYPTFEGGIQPEYRDYELTPKFTAGDSYYTNNPDKSKAHGSTTFMCMG